MSEIVDEDGRRYRVRRQRRSMIVIAVVLLAPGGRVLLRLDLLPRPTPRPGPCTTELLVAPLRPADVSLNVYNATKRNGLASAVAKTAVDRGFKVKTVGNDPKNAGVKQTAQVRFGPDGAASARLVKAHVPQAVAVNDKRKGDTVDLVVGAAWKNFGEVPVVVTPDPDAAPLPDDHRPAVTRA